MWYGPGAARGLLRMVSEVSTAMVSAMRSLGLGDSATSPRVSWGSRIAILRVQCTGGGSRGGCSWQGREDI